MVRVSGQTVILSLSLFAPLILSAEDADTIFSALDTGFEPVR